jgi:hypothetical protein
MRPYTTMGIAAVALLAASACSREPNGGAQASAADRQVAAAAATMSPAPSGAGKGGAAAVPAPNGIDVNGNPAAPGNRAGNDSRVNSWQDTPAKTGLGNAEGPVGANGAGLGVGGNGLREGSFPGPANAAGSGLGTGKPGPAPNQ